MKHHLGAAALAATVLWGCAHREPMPALRGAPDSSGIVPMTAVIDAPAQGAPWAPTAAYPILEPDHRQDARPPFASIAAAGPMEATGWLTYQTYQATFSRLDGATCRFRPTCSRFALEAIAEHGPLGVVLAFGRVHRAHGPERNYVMHDPPFLADPLADYTFWLRRARFDDFAAYSNPAHAWYQHARATRR